MFNGASHHSVFSKGIFSDGKGDLQDIGDKLG